MNEEGEVIYLVYQVKGEDVVRTMSVKHVPSPLRPENGFNAVDLRKRAVIQVIRSRGAKEAAQATLERTRLPVLYWTNRTNDGQGILLPRGFDLRNIRFRNFADIVLNQKDEDQEVEVDVVEYPRYDGFLGDIRTIAMFWWMRFLERLNRHRTGE